MTSTETSVADGEEFGRGHDKEAKLLTQSKGDCITKARSFLNASLYTSMTAFSERKEITSSSVEPPSTALQ